MDCVGPVESLVEEVVAFNAVVSLAEVESFCGGGVHIALVNSSEFLLALAQLCIL